MIQWWKTKLWSGVGRSPAFRGVRALEIWTCQFFFFFLLSDSGRGKKANFPVRQERSHNFQGTVRHVVITLKLATPRSERWKKLRIMLLLGSTSDFRRKDEFESRPISGCVRPRPRGSAYRMHCSKLSLAYTRFSGFNLVSSAETILANIYKWHTEAIRDLGKPVIHCGALNGPKRSQRMELVCLDL